MLTRKACKYCGSLWHSKNNCEKRPINPFKPQKRTQVPLSRQKPSQSIRLAYKGSSERSQLVGYADKHHSAYVRENEDRCYTCERRLEPEERQNGHFMARRHFNTRWDNMNCHVQCNECNVAKGGNLVVYEAKLRAEYGDSDVDELKQRARSGDKVTLADIQGVIDKYGVVF